MKKRFKEWISVFVVKNPAQAILLGILLINIVLLVLFALIIFALSPASAKEGGFFATLFYTISMILDAGCVQYIINDIGQTSVVLIIACLIVILIGMITFTGAIIGYVTNYISNFIENANSGNRAINVSNHTVILNWNSRGSEVINDLLFANKKEVIVVLVAANSDSIKKEIDEHLSLTIKKENKIIAESSKNMPFFKRKKYVRKNKLKNRLVVIVREGDTYSTKQLTDIAILQARTVIILGRDIQNTVCKYELIERIDKTEKGNSNTVKTLIQVADMTSSEASADNQVIVVEIDDDWTANVVSKIVAHKEKLGKCNIIPIPVNKILGQLLSQFSIMPELNFVYSELFSNQGAEFFCKQVEGFKNDEEFVSRYLKSCNTAVPLTIMDTKAGEQEFFMASEENDCKLGHNLARTDYSVKLHKNFWLEQRNIVIIGHNSNSKEIIDGFNSFRNEWNLPDKEILNVIVIDDQKSLEKRNYYKDCPYVRKTIEADVFDVDIIKKEISDFADANEQDTSVLILSDDTSLNEDIDSNALIYLVYVQDIIKEKLAKNPEFDTESIDVIVEIVNPKNYDVVRSYSVNNVIISNRYISKMITQISHKEPLYEFYKDILTYDEEGVSEYDSKELYVKKVRRFFDETPAPCTAAELIRAVYDASPENNKSIVLGYVKPHGEMVIFHGNQDNIKVNLTDKDKLIIFSNH